MEKTIVMIDSGFLSKVSYQIGEGHYFKYDLLKFSKRLAGKLNLIFKQLYIYTAPPFQDKNPSSDEKRRKEEYDSFNQKLRQNERVRNNQIKQSKTPKRGHTITIIKANTQQKILERK